MVKHSWNNRVILKENMVKRFDLSYKMKRPLKNKKNAHIRHALYVHSLIDLLLN